MKRWRLAAMLTVLLLTGMSALAVQAMAKTFSDVPSTYWAKAEIEFLTEREVINGYADGRFGITDPITRAEAAAIIIRSLGWDVSGQPDPGYSDVSSSHWAYDEIAMMKHAGFFSLEDKFEPTKLVTRAEMAQMIVNTFDLRSTSGAKFTDVKRGDPAYDEIMIMAANRITTGYEDGTFRPDAEVSRSEFAVFVVRALNEQYRPAADESLAGVQIIYDIEIGDTYVQLDAPLLLKGTWLVPEQMLRNMGWNVELAATGEVHVTTSDGLQIEIGQGAQDVWVGDELVSLTVGYEQIDGQIYIEGSPIFRSLDKPLVYYPEQRLIRIEAPRITVDDIKAGAPEAILHVVHEELPYWQWAKRDHDYLEKLRQTGSASAKDELLDEMKQLSEAFFALEQEKTVVRGLNYFSDHVTGKLDAVSRALEARYLLVFEPERYEYPGIGKSGAIGVFGYMDDHEHQYTVADFSYEHFADRKQELIEVISTLDRLNIENFRGLTIYGAPFTIVQHHPDGSIEAWSGKAIGDRHMLVASSNVGTFIHEFGHNWDSFYGDHDEYLALRGRQGYQPRSSSWGARIEENFAEDFVQAFLPDRYSAPYKADFGMPSEAETAAFIDWVAEQEREVGERPYHYMTLNDAIVIPEAIVLQDGQFVVEGIADNVVHVWMQHIETGEERTLEIPSYGSAYREVISLPEPGTYRLNVGSFNTTVLYLP